jgi:hypothetical protein
LTFGIPSEEAEIFAVIGDGSKRTRVKRGLRKGKWGIISGGVE